jgi:hypothetical protein
MENEGNDGVALALDGFALSRSASPSIDRHDRKRLFAVHAPAFPPTHIARVTWACLIRHRPVPLKLWTWLCTHGCRPQGTRGSKVSYAAFLTRCASYEPDEQDSDLSSQDVALADKSVKMLEESTVAEVGALLLVRRALLTTHAQMSETTVNKLSDLLYELAVMPASRAPAKLPALRARLANVQSQIYQHVLQDELANAVGASAGESAEK